jgi:hypothetical protein
MEPDECEQSDEDQDGEEEEMNCERQQQVGSAFQPQLPPTPFCDSNRGNSNNNRRSLGPARRRRENSDASANRFQSLNHANNNQQQRYSNYPTNHNGHMYGPRRYKRDQQPQHNNPNPQYQTGPGYPGYYYPMQGKPNQQQPHHLAPNPQALPLAPPGYYVIANNPPAMHNARQQHYYAQVHHNGAQPQFYSHVPVPMMVPQPSPHLANHGGHSYPPPHPPQMMYPHAMMTHPANWNQMMIAQNQHFLQQQQQHYQQQQHENSASSSSSLSSSTSSLGASSAQKGNSVACFYHRTGYCWKGNGCAFSHDDPEESAKEKGENGSGAMRRELKDRDDAEEPQHVDDDQQQERAGLDPQSLASSNSFSYSDSDDDSSSSSSTALQFGAQPLAHDLSPRSSVVSAVSLMAKSEMIESQVNDLERQKSNLEAYDKKFLLLFSFRSTLSFFCLLALRLES